MTKYILKRLSLMLITLWIIVTATFFLMHLLPGSPFANEEKIPPALKEQLNKVYGFDQPLIVQYGKFLGNLLKGDLGTSITREGQEVTTMIVQKFPNSLKIGSLGLLFGVFVGLILGMISAIKRGSFADNIASGIALIGVSVPNFVMGTLLSYWIGYKLGILPIGSFDSYEHWILPSLTLSFFVIAVMSRYVRSEMVEVLQQDYIKTAKAKGLSKFTTLTRHALRNALIPAITILGPLSVNIIVGSLVVEKIFAIPGMGQLFVDSILEKDYTVILGTTVFYSVLILTVMFIVDILYGIIDPRIRLTGKGA